MSEQYPGGFLTKTPPTPSGPYSTDTASGMWTLSQQAAYNKQNLWPTAGNVPKDAQFNYVTTLLHGDGTNGAQNNTFLDSSTNAFSITRNGNTTQGSFSPYGSNWGNYFDGGATYLSIATQTFTTNFTWECWYFPARLGSSSGNYSMLMGELSTSNNQFAVRTDGAITYYNGSTTTTLAPAGTIVAGTWYHIALTRQSSDTFLYVNGTLVGSMVSDSGTRYIGCIGNIAPYSTAYAVTGYLSNVRLNNTTAVYTSNFTPSTTPLTAISGTTLLTCQSNRFVDNSSGNVTVTPTGTVAVQRFNPFGESVAYSTSTYGGSGYFDGTGDYLATTSSSNLSPSSSAFTMECWFYRLASQAGNRGLMMAGTANSGGDAVGMYINSSNIISGYYGNGGINSSVAAPDGQWNHVALVRSGTGSNQTTLYLNGVSVATGTFSNTFSSPMPFYVGTTVYGALNNSEYINAYISDARFIKGTALYTGNFTPPTSPLTAISGTQLLCNMTNAGIYDNAMQNDFETKGNAQISTSVYKYGTGSMSFDGSNSSIYTPLQTKFGLKFTIEFWMYATSANSNQWMVCSAQGYNNSTDNGFLIGYYDTGSGNSISVAGYNLGAYWINGSSAVSANAWHHIAVVGDGTNCVIYADGVNIGSAAWPTSPAYKGFSTTGMYIGAGVTTSLTPINFYGGYIDDLRITNGYARYTANFTPPTAAFYNIGPNS